MEDFDTEDFFDVNEFAETATYKGAPVFAVEVVGGERQRIVESGLKSSPGLVYPVFVVVLNLGSARPKSGDAVVFRGNQYHIGGGPVSEGGGLWRVDLIKNSIQV